MSVCLSAVGILDLFTYDNAAVPHDTFDVIYCISAKLQSHTGRRTLRAEKRSQWIIFQLRMHQIYLTGMNVKPQNSLED